MKHTYIIAEIGQNHNGDMHLAKKLIDMAAMPIFDAFGNKQLAPIDAVKFCKR
jgi:sialic acid synthase